jgi:uncharacterized membrane protein
MTDYARKSATAALVSKLFYFLLLAVLAFTTLAADLPEGVSPWLVLGVKFIPLLIVLPGLIKNNLRAYIWLCFIVLFYFTRAVVDAYLSEGNNVADIGLTIITTTLFLSAMMFVKWEKAQGKSLYS